MKELLILFLYRYLVAPLARLLLPLAALKNEKIALGLQLRKNSPWLEKKMNQPVWIHCSSGEFEYAKPVIDWLKRRQPEREVLVTFFSPSSQKNINSYDGVDFSTPTPWESPRSWSEFLDHHSPSCLLIARTDLWPEMILQSRKRKIPILLFSATLAEKSGRMHPMARFFYTWLLKNISKIFCVSKEDIDNFKTLGFTQDISIQGDTRFDQVFARIENPKRLKHELFMDKKKSELFIAGSTWPEDEAVLFEVFEKIKKNHKIRFILAPHEPTDKHMDYLKKMSEKHGLSYSLYSQSEIWENDLLLIDTVGILADLYPRASFAFVGGSFRKTVHSVMEPLAAGCLTFIGPKHLNNREAIEFSMKEIESFKMATVADDAQEFHAILNRQLSTGNIDELNLKISEKTKSKKGGSSAVADWVEDVYKDSKNSKDLKPNQE